jgi:hypothetical protein
MSGVEVSRRLRIFLANPAIASGWALKGACKPCAHGLFTTARWLVPEAQRFFVQRLSGPNRNQMSFEWLRSRMQLRIVAGLLVVLAFWGALNFALRISATDTQALVDRSASQQEPPGSPESVSKSSPTQGSIFETGSISAAQTAPVPLPERKPARVSKVANRKGAAAIPATQKRTASAKNRLSPKPRFTPRP